MFQAQLARTVPAMMLTCRMSVPIVICPWGELVTLLSVRHFTTMDVDDMETCTRHTASLPLTWK